MLRYAPQRVCSATVDADAAAGEEVEDGATVEVFARLDAPAAVAGARFAAPLGVLGPAITFVFLLLS